jgi:glycosyltransferase involved in cell wall biosynthesis
VGWPPWVSAREAGWERMRQRPVCLFMPTLGAGGAERVMLAVAGYLCETGRDVDLVVTRAEGRLCQEIPEGLRVVDLSAPRVRNAFSGLALYLRRRDPSCVLATLNHAIILAVTARDLVCPDVRIVGRISTNVSVSLRNHRFLKRRLLSGAMQWGLGRVDRVVAVSAGVAKDLRSNWRVPPDRLRVIANPIDVERVRRSAAHRVDHPWLRVDRTWSVIVSVGRLEAVKGHADLIDAVAMLRRASDVRAILVGDGPLREGLRQRAEALGVEDAVDLVGYRDNPFAFASQCDVFVQPSHREGMPNALIEALAVAPRIVATDCESGPREVLASGRWGALAAVCNPESLARAIAGTLNEHGTIENRDSALEPFEYLRIMAAYERAIYTWD